MRHLDPRVRIVWRVGTAVTAVVVTAIDAALTAAVWLSDGAPSPGLALLVLVVGTFVGAIATWRLPDLRYRHWTYEVGELALELHHGVVMRTESAVPYFRVQHVDTEQGPIDRRFGLASLKLHTASAATDAKLPGLAVDDAEALRRTILERAGAGDAV